MPNRLANETSPYLLQHAHNPVDWYPWGHEALARAKAEDKPILLSIGYSACHWCHVMERESFENPRIAELMNSSFVSIKVDREERPDLDGIYMQAVQAMTGQGGWPMTVFLTPDGAPFFGGTYYPPTDRGQMPGFPRVLLAIADAWQKRRDEVVASSARLRDELRASAQLSAAAGLLNDDMLREAARGLISQYDPDAGGFGRAPKFPQPMAIEFLLRWWRRTTDAQALDVVTHTLERMATGGIYDHLGGGFARYSTDNEWLVPHFEKMLYDNAQLARAYLMAYQATDNAFFQHVAEEVIEYVLRDMTDESGGFYSTEDADSEGEEGKFYLWTPSEVLALLGAEDGRLFCAFYDVRAPGNFEGRASILRIQQTPLEVAQREGVSEAELLSALERGREVLFQARNKRVRPARDEKVLASWNGMMLRALAEAASVLDRHHFLRAAERNAEFLLSSMYVDRRLHRTWKPGHSARLNAYLEDYANVADGLLALYEATFEPRWLEASMEFADRIVRDFIDAQNGGFFDTSSDHETLITRPKDIFDNATPSGNSVAADVLLRLAVLTDRGDYREAAEGVLRLLETAMRRYPLGFARALNALDFFLDTPREIAIVGSDVRALRRAVFEPFAPNKVVAGSGARIPLLEGRDAPDGDALAYLCQHYVCQAPTSDANQLRRMLVGDQ